MQALILETQVHRSTAVRVPRLRREDLMRRHQSRAADDEALYHEFQEHCSELYWLALLLTGDRERSIQAFTKALDLDYEVNAADLISEFSNLEIEALLSA